MFIKLKFWILDFVKKLFMKLIYDSIFLWLWNDAYFFFQNKIVKLRTRRNKVILETNSFRLLSFIYDYLIAIKKEKTYILRCINVCSRGVTKATKKNSSLYCIITVCVYCEIVLRILNCLSTLGGIYLLHEISLV